MNINPVSLEAIELPLTRSARRIFGGTIHESGFSFRVSDWVDPVMELGGEIYGFWLGSRSLNDELCQPLESLLHESIQTRPTVA